MKIAVTGKGGSGKTAVAAIVARTLARRGYAVIAVDADPNPNLGLSLGLAEPQLRRVDGIVNVLLREKAAHDRAHRAGAHGHGSDEICAPPPERTADELVVDMGVIGPDGVTLVETGRIERPADGCLCCGSHGTTRRIYSGLSALDRVVVADLEAGANDLVWAAPSSEDVVIVVTEPYLKSLEVAKRALLVAAELGVSRVFVAANRVLDDADVAQVRDVVGDRPLFAIPDDPELAGADRAGTAAMDLSPPPPAVGAIGLLVDCLLASNG